MLKYLLFLFGLTLATTQIQGQNMRFARSYGHNLLDLIYTQDSTRPKLSNMDYMRCCVANFNFTDPLPIQFGAWVKNSSNTVQTTYLKLLLKHGNQTLQLYSDTVSANPGDSLKLQCTPIQHHALKGARYMLYANNTLIDQDSISLNKEATGINHSKLVQYFGPKDSEISTNVLGDDGSGVALLYPVDQGTSIEGVSFYISPSSSLGGDMLFRVYDSAAFSPTTGFSGTPLLITQQRITQYGWQQVNFTNGPSFPVGNALKHVWLCINFFSNGGFSPVALGSSNKILPGRNAVWFFNAKRNTFWKSARDSSSYINNPLAHLNIFIYHIDPINLNENTTELRMRLFPNPAQNRVQIQLPDVWKSAHLSIVSLTGSVVLRQEDIASGENLMTQTLEPGMYVVQATNNGRRIHTKLLIE